MTTVSTKIHGNITVGVSNGNVSLLRSNGREVIGVRYPNKDAVTVALAIGDESHRLQAEYGLTIPEVKDLFFDVCESFPSTMLDWYRRLCKDRDENFEEFMALHQEGRSITYILGHFRRLRARKAA